MKLRRYILAIDVLTACLVLVSACATVPKETDLRDSLRSAAVSYWNLRMEEKYEETYAMEDREGLLPYKDYLVNVMAMKRMYIVSHSVKEVRMEGHKGIAEVEFSYVMDSAKKPYRQPLTDQWVYKEGKWRHILIR